MNNLRLKSKAYKPFLYPWAFDAWEKQQQIHWIPAEIPMSEDVKDWRNKLSDTEISFLTQIFRFFTQADIEVSGGYLDNYIHYFKNNEIRMMLTAFANIETVHIAAYATLIETLGLPDSEFSKFLEYEEMVKKSNFLQSFSIENETEVLKTLAVYSGFTEGLQLFASFAMLLNFPRFNLMKGMGQVVTWSVRDESLHCESMIKLFHEFSNETGKLNTALKNEIRDIAIEMVDLENAFIDLAFGISDQKELSPQEVRNYVKYICDWRLKQLGISPIFKIEEYPLPWLRPILNGVEHSNFFEQRATEYTKEATVGSWENVWKKFDNKKNIALV